MAATDIAVIGMSGRFPGARDIAALWSNLRGGVESVTFLDEAQLRAAGVSQALLDDPDYVRAAYLLDDADRFDAAFFGYSPREARFIDPQQRVLLECAWNALEDAGYAGAGLNAGVYAGCSLNTYLLNTGAAAHFARDPVLALMSSDKDFLATRIGYKLGLEGPCLSVQSACSTSLVALHVACQSLLADECDLALAGGACVKVPLHAGYLHREGGMLSRDGHCRPFDSRASGTIFGSGAAIVVLKRLDAALADGDTVHAVVKATAINNDGARKASYTAPSVEGIADVLRQALAFAEMSPPQIGYVECHGTGTPLGDPIELRALRSAWRIESDTVGGALEESRCALGSVKSNIGHLEAAAGITGFIKAVCCVREGEIPATLHFESPNPALELAPPFYIADRCQAWPAAGGPRTAAVLSLGVGGTNAAVVLQQPPAPAPRAPTTQRWHALPCSARTVAQHQALRAALNRQVEALLPGTIADAAWTLAHGRTALGVRDVWCYDAAAGRLEGRATATSPSSTSDGPSTRKAAKPVIVFTFGEVDADLLTSALEGEPEGRRQLQDATAELVAAAAREGIALPHDRRTRRHCGQVALARLWRDWGVVPTAMLCDGRAALAAAQMTGAIAPGDVRRLLDDREVEEPADATCFAPGDRPAMRSLAPASAARLAQACEALLDRHASLLVLPIGGPGRIDAALKALLGASANQSVIEPLATRGDDEPPPLLQQACALWCAGLPIDLAARYRHERRNRIALAPMPFQGPSHWW